MKYLFSILFMLAKTFSANAQTDQKLSMKQLLLSQLKTTHNKEEWFAPLNIALEGVTPEQAAWKEKGADHSIEELANHIIFWNSEELAKFLNIPKPAFSGDNNETFSKKASSDWPSTVKKADSVLTAWEQAIEAADETKLAAWYEIIGHINTHNAYHTGQIVYIRKVQGSWNPSKGVK